MLLYLFYYSGLVYYGKNKLSHFIFHMSVEFPMFVQVGCLFKEISKVVNLIFLIVPSARLSRNSPYLFKWNYMNACMDIYIYTHTYNLHTYSTCVRKSRKHICLRKYIRMYVENKHSYVHLEACLPTKRRIYWLYSYMYILFHVHPLLGSGLVNKFPRRQILDKQSVARLHNKWGCVFYAVCAKQQ
jgi:hypothetical protein